MKIDFPLTVYPVDTFGVVYESFPLDLVANTVSNIETPERKMYNIKGTVTGLPSGTQIDRMCYDINGKRQIKRFANTITIINDDDTINIDAQHVRLDIAFEIDDNQ